VCVELSRIYGKECVGILEKLAPFFLSRAKVGNHEGIRTLSIGAVAESIMVGNPDTSRLLPIIMPTLINGMSDENEVVMRNCAFCVGISLQNSSSGAITYIQESLLKLGKLIQSQEVPAVVKDNAISALCRIATTFIEHIPIDQVFLGIISGLPLKEDQDENNNVYESICKILSLRPQVVCFTFAFY